MRNLALCAIKTRAWGHADHFFQQLLVPGAVRQPHMAYRHGSTIEPATGFSSWLLRLGRSAA